MKFKSIFKRGTGKVNKDVTIHTWQTELLKALRTQPKTDELNNLIDSLLNHQPDPGTVASELKRIGLPHFSELLTKEFYHFRAKDTNIKNGVKLGDTEVKQ